MKNMKKFNIYKTLQLLLMILLTGLSVFLIILNPEVYQFVTTNFNIRIVCGLLWAVLAVSFLFLWLDFSAFSTYKKDYIELDETLRSDPVSGLPNRYSCDVYINQLAKEAPAGDFGCTMIDLANLFEINQEFSRRDGDFLLKQFSDILTSASSDLCFVGRNGINKFLAIYEHTTPENMVLFLSRVKELVDAHNADPDFHKIQFHFGSVHNSTEKEGNIFNLISLANHRAADMPDNLL